MEKPRVMAQHSRAETWLHVSCLHAECGVRRRLLVKTEQAIRIQSYSNWNRTTFVEGFVIGGVPYTIPACRELYDVISLLLSKEMRTHRLSADRSVLGAPNRSVYYSLRTE